MAAPTHPAVAGLLNFIKMYPVPVGVAAFLAFLLIVFLAGNLRIPFKGRLVGILFLYGFQGRFYRRFSGLFVEITDALSREALEEFKEAALEDVEGTLENASLGEGERNVANKFRDALSKLDAGKIRVYGSRRNWMKHLWIVVGVDRSLEEYAFYSRFVSFEFPFGFLRRISVYGIQYDIPGYWKVKPYGKVKVHVFIPLLDSGSEQYWKAANSLSEEDRVALATVAVKIRAALTMHLENKELKRELEATRKRLEAVSGLISKYRKEADLARIAAGSKSLFPPGELEARLPGAPRVKPDSSSVFALVVFMLLCQMACAVLLPKFLAVDAAVAALLGSIAGVAGFLAFSQRGRREAG